jgi:hypothetical protein
VNSLLQPNDGARHTDMLCPSAFPRKNAGAASEVPVRRTISFTLAHSRAEFWKAPGCKKIQESRNPAFLDMTGRSLHRSVSRSRSYTVLLGQSLPRPAAVAP